MTQTQNYQTGHALVIAIAEYDRVNPLPKAVLNDANDLVSVLTARDGCRFSPDNVLKLINEQATRNAILEGLRDLAVRATTEDTVCIYFTGHGALIDEYDDAVESVLVPADCDLDHLLATSISSAELSAALDAIPAKRLVVFIDACHAAGAAALKLAGKQAIVKLGYAEKSLDRLADGKGRTLMASSRTDETSLIMHGDRNSAFTSVLLEGLKGGADQRGDGEIRVFDLFDYISKGVPSRTKDKQHPVFKAARLEQNFCVAVYHGGSKQAIQSSAPRTGTDITSELNALMSEFYPGGPADQEIWVRSGGDMAALRLQGSGRAQWFAAIRVLMLGGGGRSISPGSLIETALADFANNESLLDLRHRI
ncbi:MAG: caspase family protein [Paraburkholderia sp.]|uniref:caspase family protein n=1 Tax=Paraburkholderia sp. TaxID=1926495 RepID=UPI003C4346C1